MNTFRRRSSGATFSLAFWLLLSVSYAQSQVAVQIGQKFTGTDNSNLTSPDLFPLTPADGNGAVGPNHFVEFINGAFTVYNKSNGHRALGITADDFWTAAGVTIPNGRVVSDPRIIFDPVSQRWFASQVDAVIANDPSLYSDYFLLAVSDTADPTGTWHGFRLITDPASGNFADFPTLGVDANAVYLAGDMYYGQSNSLGTALTMIPKADLLANPPVITNRVFFGTTSYADARRHACNPPPVWTAAVAEIFWRRGLWATIFFRIPISWPPGFIIPARPAPRSRRPQTFWLTPTARPSIQRSPTEPPRSPTMTHASAQEFTRSAASFSPFTTSRWTGAPRSGGIVLALTNYALLESGTIADPDLDLFYPSIAANTNGIVVIGCNGCSLNTYISSYAYVGLTANGVTTFGSPILLASGSVNYHDLYEQTGYSPTGESRWGDYSTVAVDPSDPARFWTIQMLPLYNADLDLFDTGDGVLWQMQITELVTSLPSPQLSIARSGANVLISWSLPTASYQLQSITNLTASNSWSLVTQTPSTNGNQISVSVPITGNQKYFRLLQGP